MARLIHRGITLIELLVTLAIVVILLLVAGPSFSEFMNETRSRYQANQFLSAINLARSEAITRVERVTLCAAKVDDKCSTDATWNEYWILFTDNDTIGTMDSPNDRIKVFKGLGDSIQIGASEHVENFVSFTGSGLPKKSDGTALAEEKSYFTICGKNGTDDFSLKATNSRIVSISKSGRINITKDGYYPDIKNCIDPSDEETE